MTRTVTLSLAAGALALGASLGTAQAAPTGGVIKPLKPLAAQSSVIEKVQYRCVRRCLRFTALPPRACRRRCYGFGPFVGAGFVGGCVPRCIMRTGMSSWACRRACYGGYGFRSFGRIWW